MYYPIKMQIFAARFTEAIKKIDLKEHHSLSAIFRSEWLAPARQTLDPHQREKVAGYLRVRLRTCIIMEQGRCQGLVWWDPMVVRFSKGVKALVPPRTILERQADFKD